jgi:hypothetical protein
MQDEIPDYIKDKLTRISADFVINNGVSYEALLEFVRQLLEIIDEFYCLDVEETKRKH